MNLSRTNAVKKHCKECSGPDNGNRSASLCTSYECYLWPFRVGSPQQSEIETHLQTRAALDERNRLMRQKLRARAVS
jgi:hypothetical protein